MKHSGWKREPAAETMRPEIGRAQVVQSTPVRTLVGVQCERLEVTGIVFARGNDLEEWFWGFGSGRVEDGGPLTAMDGIDGVIEIDGALIFGIGADGSLTEIVGMGGTDTDGPFFTPEALLTGAGLTEIDGASWTEIVGMGAETVECGLGRAGGS